MLILLCLKIKICHLPVCMYVLFIRKQLLTGVSSINKRYKAPPGHTGSHLSGRCCDDPRDQGSQCFVLYWSKTQSTCFFPKVWRYKLKEKEMIFPIVLASQCVCLLRFYSYFRNEKCKHQRERTTGYFEQFSVSNQPIKCNEKDLPPYGSIWQFRHFIVSLLKLASLFVS